MAKNVSLTQMATPNAFDSHLLKNEQVFSVALLVPRLGERVIMRLERIALTQQTSAW
jgi:hypothetical protein